MCSQTMCLLSRFTNGLAFRRVACFGQGRLERNICDIVAMEVPMISLQDLSEAFGRNISIVLQQTNDLTNEESFLHLPGGSNCLNWVLGHIAANRDTVLKVLGEDLEIGEASARYKRES